MKSISEIEKKCNQRLNVIHFDFTKDQICKHCRLKPLKSCDALKILPAKNAMDFIELKSIVDLITNSRDVQECKDLTNKFELPIKAYNSLQIIDNLICLETFQLTKQERDEYHHSTIINFILAIDLDIDYKPNESFLFLLKLVSTVPNSPEKKPIEQFIRIIKIELDTQLERISGRSRIVNVQLLKFNEIDSHYQT